MTFAHEPRAAWIETRGSSSQRRDATRSTFSMWE
eukprot:CAMPEP_0194536568 /NCGR_PEP_ID=MMETSP0253-20130528/75535_1 /TAXON_ID=2966 /ORGANISM="Noctiluca scintillans" /LENGTH=33 /DNA_ID= /DNA_START= /DNA_END= /DNA_ORIENTATION=